MVWTGQSGVRIPEEAGDLLLSTTLRFCGPHSLLLSEYWGVFPGGKAALRIGWLMPPHPPPPPYASIPRTLPFHALIFLS